MCLLAASISTAVIRSSTAFSHFSRFEYCSICGIKQSYCVVCIIDRPVLRSTSRFENGVSRILGSTKKHCGHNFHSVQERMIHFSPKRTPSFIEREHGRDNGSDVFSNEKYISALGEIHATNSDSSQLIWSRTMRHFANGASNPPIQIRAVLEKGNNEDVKGFLTTNRFFRPARPNPERVFYATF